MGLFDWLFRRKQPTMNEGDIGTGAAAAADSWTATDADDSGTDDSGSAGFDSGGSDGGAFDGGGGGSDGGSSG